MDADQKLICKGVNSLNSYPFVLNCEKRNQYAFQYQVITFNYCTTVVFIGVSHLAQLEQPKYGTVYVLTLHLLQMLEVPLLMVRKKWKAQGDVPFCSKTD